MAKLRKDQIEHAMSRVSGAAKKKAKERVDSTIKKLRSHPDFKKILAVEKTMTDARAKYDALVKKRELLVKDFNAKHTYNLPLDLANGGFSYYGYDLFKQYEDLRSLVEETHDSLVLGGDGLEILKNALEKIKEL